MAGPTTQAVVGAGLPTDAPPLSPGQRGLWRVHERGATSVYHDRSVFEVAGPLDGSAFRSAVQVVLDRYPVLRRRVVVTPDGPRQVTDDAWRIDVPVVAPEPGADRAVAVAAFLREWTTAPFSLADGPPVLAAILRLGADEHVVAFAIHRLVADCWSTDLLFAELSDVYADLVAGREPGAAPSRPGYDDFVRWQRSAEQEAELDHHLEYWTEHVAGAPDRLDFRAEPRSAAPGATALTRVFELPADAVAGMQDLAQTGRTTLYAVLLSAFQLVVAHAAGERDVLVGAPVAGRTEIEFEESIGYFVNLLALRADLRDDPTGTELVTRVRKTVLRGMAHQDLPFETLVERLGVRAPVGVHPLVQATLQVIDEHGAHLRLAGTTCTAVLADEYQIAYALTLNLYVAGDRIRGRLLYDPAQVGAGVARELTERFARLAVLLPRHADETVTRLLERSGAPEPVAIETED